MRSSCYDLQRVESFLERYFTIDSGCEAFDKKTPPERKLGVLGE
jgi:hypothetical protein